MSPILSCGGPTFNFEGHWSGKRSLPLSPEASATIRNTISKVEVDLKPNGKFEMFDAGMPKSGTYRIDGMRAYLTVETIMQKPVADQGSAAVAMNKEVILTAQKDGSVVFADPGGILQEPVRMVREKIEAQPGK